MKSQQGELDYSSEEMLIQLGPSKEQLEGLLDSYEKPMVMCQSTVLADSDEAVGPPTRRIPEMSSEVSWCLVLTL